jgi:hypothetical protein
LYILNGICYLDRYKPDAVPLELVKEVSKQVLLGLHWCHRIAGVVHTGALCLFCVLALCVPSFCVRPSLFSSLLSSPLLCFSTSRPTSRPIPINRVPPSLHPSNFVRPLGFYQIWLLYLWTLIPTIGAIHISLILTTGALALSLSCTTFLAFAMADLSR